MSFTETFKILRKNDLENRSIKNRSGKRKETIDNVDVVENYDTKQESPKTIEIDNLNSESKKELSEMTLISPFHRKFYQFMQKIKNNEEYKNENYYVFLDDLIEVVEKTIKNVSMGNFQIAEYNKNLNFICKSMRSEIAKLNKIKNDNDRKVKQLETLVNLYNFLNILIDEKYKKEKAPTEI